MFKFFKHIVVLVACYLAIATDAAFRRATVSGLRALDLRTPQIARTPHPARSLFGARQGTSWARGSAATSRRGMMTAINAHRQMGLRGMNRGGLALAPHALAMSNPMRQQRRGFVLTFAKVTTKIAWGVVSRLYTLFATVITGTYLWFFIPAFYANPPGDLDELLKLAFGPAFDKFNVQYEEFKMMLFRRLSDEADKDGLPTDIATLQKELVEDIKRKINIFKTDAEKQVEEGKSQANEALFSELFKMLKSGGDDSKKKDDDDPAKK